MVRRERGAVMVFAVDPAQPPQNKCLRAFIGRDSCLGSSSSSSREGLRGMVKFR